MTNGKQKGDRRERELVNKLDARGMEILRSPASGAATNRELPDVTASNGDIVIAIEVKSSSGEPIYIDGKEIHDLLVFCKSFRATPRVGIKFNREDWKFFAPEELYMTDGENFRIKKSEDLDRGETLQDIINLNS